ncbi:lisH domain-containing protein ARMC9-like isoform X2 [Bombus pyrosoma]|uniref:lisH domain-containing protein ARMC9-like isoform X2 n=1 Tax=Bombus pyrosoma TaxID=396416 RepID=UPI001CB94A8B|nr:lisH domain-containing protein ARMC9-like isoform X2 [Bombus pyrosoma]
MDKNRAINKMDNKELKLVHQFLIDHDFENTADALMVEATIKGFKHLKNDLQTEGDMYENCYEQLMFSYKTGDWKTFFNLWNLIVPEDAKQTKACKILMLHIYVYFAMLPKHMLMLHWYKKKDKIQAAVSDLVTSSNQQDSECEENVMTEIEKNMNDSMERLRTFLNTTGKELENDAELRPYFAFPFMEDPYAEPFLSNIFEKSWSDKLTNHLQLFLKNYKQQSFSNTKYNDENSDKFSSSYTSLSEDSKKDVIAKKAIKNNNVPIIPNDRNIPMFLEDDESEEQPIFYDSIKYSQKSNIQTVSMNSSEEEICSSHFTKRNKKLMQCTQELAVAKSHLCSVHSNYEKLKIRFYKLHADYHKLMSIARVLTSALEDSVKGQVIDFQAMLETCIRIFPDLFNQNIKDSTHCSSELLLAKSRSDMKTIEYSNSNNIFIPPKLLNFKKIKLHLINGSIKTKLFLLQALRRKITFSQPGERDETVHEYISKDLLGLHSQIASYRGKSILPYLLTPQNIIIPHPLQQSVTRLLNALASFRCGRDYLSFDSTVVDTVFRCMNSISDNNIDTLTCNMMIAMLQKLSLRKQQRIYMIENGLMEWLIHHLHDQYRIMDSYRLEYATALLMNLSLHQTAQRRVSTMAPLLMSTLIDLLLMDHESALPYINGALNNFLTNHVFNEEAKRIKFSSIIEQYSKYKTGEIRKHLDHILKIHRGEITIKTENEEMADNDNEEFDVLESQLDENDPVKNNYGELCGELLLESCYTILPKAIQEKETISDELSFPQFKTEVTDSAMQNNQIKNLFSEHESIQHEEILPRKLVNSKPNVKTKTNIVILQNSIKKTISYPKPQPRVVELKSSSTKVFNEKLTIKLKFKIYIYNVFKDRQIFKVQVANERWNSKNDKTFVKEIHNESAMYLYENHTSKESSKTTLASSMLLGVGSEAESTVMEKLSSIASLNTEDSNRIANDKVSWTQETKSDTEEAFLAKPKLPRTPP